jgi:ribosomal protein L32
MPVPKKRQSKTKTNKRKTVWKNEAKQEARKAISTAKSVLKDLLESKN